MTPSVTLNGDLYWEQDNFTCGFDTNFRDKMYADISNMHTVPYLWTLNFHGAYREGDVEIGLRVNNLTNKVNYYNAAVADNGRVLYFRNSGINFNLSIKYNF
jgi:hypothetical protein